MNIVNIMPSLEIICHPLGSSGINIVYLLVSLCTTVVMFEELILTMSTSSSLKWFKSMVDDVMFVSSIQLLT